MKAYATSSEGRMVESDIETHPEHGEEFDLLKVYGERKRQEIIGFGAAITEASAIMFSKLDDNDKEQFISLCFSDEGNAYSLCRLTIGSCDFSEHGYIYVRDGLLGAISRSSQGFSIGHDRDAIIPMIRSAQEARPGLGFIASPWSPPAYMKTSLRRTFGGHLRKRSYGQWAQIIAKYLLAYAGEGIHIGRITVQNEPMARQIWESCLYSPEEEREFAVDALVPALEQAGLGEVKVLIWDHNKDKVLERVEATLLEERTEGAIDGVAFHWYTGDHFEELREVHELFPNMELIFTEGCTAYSSFEPGQQLADAEKYAHEIIGDINAGANACIDWNILLDGRGGPNHAHNYCDAPLMYDEDEHILRRNLSFDYIGAFSHFVRPGAHCVLVSRHTADIEAAGFVNPDGGRVLVVLNRTDSEQPYSVDDGIRVAPYTQKPHSIVTFTW